MKEEQGNIYESTDYLEEDKFELLIQEWLITEFKNNTGIDITINPIALQRIMESAKNAKIELFLKHSTEINIPFLASDNGKPKHLHTILYRTKFEQIVSDLM